jgi:uncharacterized membrane protein
MNDLQKFLLAYVTFIVVDSPWLAYSGKYFSEVAGGTEMEPYPAALLAYVALATAIVYIGLPLGEYYKEHPVLIPGMLIGFCVYFCFDMTNRVIFGKRYPWWLALSDTAWGMLASTVTLYIVRSFVSETKNEVV